MNDEINLHDAAEWLTMLDRWMVHHLPDIKGEEIPETVTMELPTEGLQDIFTTLPKIITRLQIMAHESKGDGIRNIH